MPSTIKTLCWQSMPFEMIWNIPLDSSCLEISECLPISFCFAVHFNTIRPIELQFTGYACSGGRYFRIGPGVNLKTHLSWLAYMARSMCKDMARRGLSPLICIFKRKCLRIDPKK